jgi:hypothetical protein
LCFIIILIKKNKFYFYFYFCKRIIIITPDCTEQKKDKKQNQKVEKPEYLSIPHYFYEPLIHNEQDISHFDPINPQIDNWNQGINDIHYKK